MTLRIRVDWQDERTDFWFIGPVIYGTWYSVTDLVFDVHSDYWDYKSMDQLLLYVVWVDEI